MGYRRRRMGGLDPLMLRRGGVSTLLDGIIAAWNCTELSGIRYDSTTNALNLTDNGAVGNGAGIAGNGIAANLTGANWLSHVSDPLLAIGAGTSFTFSVWIRPGTNLTTRGILSRWKTGKLEYALYIYGNRAEFAVGDGTNLLKSITGLGTISREGRWSHILAWVNASVKKIYLRWNNDDVIESTAYVGDIGSTDVEFEIGRFNAGLYQIGRIAQVYFWKRVLTSVEQDALWAWGVGLPYPFLSPGGSITTLNNIIFEGDSLTISSIGTPVPYPDQAIALLYAIPETSCVWHNVASAGNQVSDMITQGPTQIDVHYNASYISNITVIWGGTNDLDLSENAATVWARIKTWCAARKAAGFQTVVVTIIKRGDVGWTAAKETERLTLNVLIRAGDPNIDAIADPEPDANLADPNNVTYFQDKIHLTTAGYAIVASYVNAAVAGL